jgi:hypothetical protein
MVFVEGDDYRALRRPGDDPAQFRSPVRLPRANVPDIAVVDGLVAWYRFEDSANTAIDYTNEFGVGADQTAIDGAVNGASFVPNDGVRDVVSGANPSGAYEFDGVDDDITIPDANGIDFDSEPFSFGAWTKPDFSNTQNNDGVLVRANSFSNPEIQYAIKARSGGNMRVAVGDGTANVTQLTVTPPSNSLFHIFGVYEQSNTELRIFINGNLVASSTAVAPESITAPLNIGQFAGGNGRFSGVVDDVRLYNRALSASEINQIYTNTDPDQ